MAKEETAARDGNGAAAGEEARARALRSKMMAAAFGEIVSVLMRSPHYKHYSLADLEWLVVPPLLANQFSLAEARAKESGFAAPVGIALWATVSEEVDRKLAEGLDRPVRLRPDEWRSGEILWLIDAIGAPKTVDALVEQLTKAAFAGKSFKIRSIDKDGKRAVKIVQPAPEAEQAAEPEGETKGKGSGKRGKS